VILRTVAAEILQAMTQRLSRASDNLQTAQCQYYCCSIIDWGDLCGLLAVHRGTFFVQYEMREELGEGAFGKAVKVRRRRDGRMFVAKIMHEQGLTDRAREEVLRCSAAPDSPVVHATVTGAREPSSCMHHACNCVCMHACVRAWPQA
jgi:hypothetical protein